MRQIGETHDGTRRSSLGRPSTYATGSRSYNRDASSTLVASREPEDFSHSARMSRSDGLRREAQRSARHHSSRSTRRNPSSRPKIDPRLLVVAAAACLVLVIGWLAVRSLDMLSQETDEPAQQLPSLHASQTNTGEKEPPPTSTPKEQWAKGSVPLLYQTDPAWADHPYAGGTMKKDGCGPTALCMAYIAATGKTDMTPADMADWAQQHGYASAGNGSSWTLISEGAAELGLSVKEITPTPQSIKNALDSGGVVVAVVGPGDFTEVGHFLVFERMTSDGSLVVHDPNSAGHSMRSWDAQRICNQINNVWALSAS